MPEPLTEAQQQALERMRKERPEAYQRFMAARERMPDPTPAPTPAPAPEAPPQGVSEEQTQALERMRTERPEAYQRFMAARERVSVAPTEAGGVAPSSSEPPVSVSGPLDQYKTTVTRGQTGFFGYGAGETGKYAGASAVDLSKARASLVNARMTNKVDEFQVQNKRKPTLEEAREMRAMVKLDVASDLQKWMAESRNQGSNTLFYDPDPYGKIQARAKAAEESFLGLGRLTAPIRQSFEGVDIAFSESSSGFPETHTYNEGDAWGNFEWFSRLSLGTWYLTALKAAGKEDLGTEVLGPLGLPAKLALSLPDVARVWGTEEHLKLIGEGHESFSLIDQGMNLAIPKGGATDKIMSNLTQPVFGADASTALNYGTAFVLSLFDPDALLLVGPAGKVGRVGKAAAVAGAVRAAGVALPSLPAAAKTTDAASRVPPRATTVGDIASVISKDAARSIGIDRGLDVYSQAEDAMEAALAAGKGNQEAFEAAREAIYEVAGPRAQVYLDNLEFRMRAMLTDRSPVSSQLDEAIRRGIAQQRRSEQVYGTSAQIEAALDEAIAPGVRRPVDPVVSERARLQAEKKTLEGLRPIAEEVRDQTRAFHAAGEALDAASAKARASVKGADKLEGRTLTEIDAQLAGVRERYARARSVESRPAGAVSRRPPTVKQVELSRELTSEHLKRVQYTLLANDIQSALDALTTVKGMMGTTRLSKAARNLINDPDAAKALDSAIESKFAQVDTLSKELYTLSSEAEGAGVASAKRAKSRELQMAWREFTNLANQAARSGSEAGEQALRNLSGATKSALKQSQEKYDELLAKGKKQKHLKKTLEGLDARNSADLGRVTKYTTKLAKSRRNEEMVAGAMRDSLRTIKEQYLTLKVDPTDVDSAAIALQIERTLFEGAHVYAGSLGRFLAGTRDKVFYPFFAGWRKKYAFTTNEQVANALNDSLGMLRYGLHELAEVASMVPKGATAHKAVIKYLTSVDSLPKRGGGVSTYNAVGGESISGRMAPWEEAYDLLMNLTAPYDKAKKAQAAAEADTAHQAVVALSKMFIKDGSALAREDSGALLGIVRNSLKSSGGDFEKFMEAMQKGTGGLLRYGATASDVSIDKAYNIAAQSVMSLSAIRRASARMTSFALDSIAESEKIPRERLAQALTNAANPSKMGEGFEDALLVFEKMGMRYDLLNHYKRSQKIGKTGIQAFGDGTGTAAFLPRQFISAMEAQVSKIVKSSDFYKQSDQTADVAALEGFARFYGHLVSASLVTGLIFPKPQHFTTIVVGNFAQTWAREGFSTAVRSQARALDPRGMQIPLKPYVPASLDFLPGPIGAWAKENRTRMAQALGAPEANVLPTPLVVMNPYVNEIYDTRLMPDSMVLRAPDGTEIGTAGEIRKTMVENGVLSSFIGATSLKEVLLRKANGDGWLAKAARMASMPKQTYAAVADVVEQRQRVALYLDLVVNKKLNPAEAAERVKQSLYDWNSPMGEFEERFIARIAMFWHFQKRALGQAASILASPFTEGGFGGQGKFRNMSGIAAKLTGGEASAAAHVKDMAKVKQMVQTAQRGAVDEETQKDAALKRVYPQWAAGPGSKHFMYTEKMDPNFAKAYEDATGKKVTHQAYTLPSLTPLEMVNTYLTFGEAVFAGMLQGKGIGGKFAEGVVWPTAEFAVDQSGQIAGPAMEEIARTTLGVDKRVDQIRWSEKDRSYYKLADKWALETLSMLGLMNVSEDREKPGALRLTPAGGAVYGMMSPLSFELNNAIGPLLEEGLIEDEEARSALRVLAQYSGIYRRYYYNPEEILEWDAKETKGRITTAAGKRREAGRAPMGYREMLEQE